MPWDASATLQLLAIIGSTASVGMAWYQRSNIATASHWLRGITHLLSQLSNKGVQADTP
jgi:hypothetical protein